MRSGTIAFLLGVVLFTTRETLLPVDGFFAALCAAALLLLAFTPTRWLAFGLAGFLWTAVHARALAPPVWLADHVGRDLVVSGTIDSIPRDTGRAWRFVMRLDTLHLAAGDAPAGTRVRLNWYRLPPGVRLAPGQRWRFTVRLKPPRGYRNPGSFDYEAWLYQRRIRATGYVRAGPATLLAAQNGELVTRLRARLREAVRAALRDEQGAVDADAGILVALLTGFRGDLSPAQRRLLQRTGTSHLIAISGLHVGLVAGLAFWLGRRLWRLLPPLQGLCTAPAFAAGAALAAAAGYAALAGFSVPTQRAFIMTAVLMGLVMAQRRLPWGDGLLLALAGVLLWDPLAVLAGGFWLSFAAVALIAVVVFARVGPPPARLPARHLARPAAGKVAWQLGNWGRVQLAMLVGLLPIGSALFGYVPLWSPLANLLAIPLVGLLVVPLCLLGALVYFVAPALAAGLWGLAARLLDGLWPVLTALDGLPLATWPVAAPSIPALGLAVLGGLWLLAPRGWPRRWLGAVLLLPLLFAQVARPPPGQFRATVLDVGQGLAVVVETRRHVLVYDAGPRFGPGFDTGEAVVAPFLRRRGIARIDTLVVSHPDNDHAGGVAGLARALPIARVLGSAPVVVPGGAGRGGQAACVAGQRWDWDGVAFEVIYPEWGPGSGPGSGSGRRASENDRSCVLRINGRGGARLLLTGDIEAASEARLVARYGHALRSTVLVVPHHGSNTSSTRAFLVAVAPRLAIVAAGYRNRYRFPTKRIRARYARLGIPLVSTIEAGAVSVDWRDGAPVLTRHAERHRRFWHGDPD